MKKNNGNDIIEMMTHFQKKILEQKPSLDKMFEEIRMMKFKIRPLNGDISLLDLKNNHFIEILWSLGKLDEFFQFQYKKVSVHKRSLFIKLFDEMHDKFQEDLNNLNLKPEKLPSTTSAFEMEIFKERTQQSN
ncbi:MAG: hypothetical protein HYW86_00645 [Candidatus Roizmanbacteria bacterium]|nr:MAG: hypothetical protein HYW86_00645 [Candidatus Roizmanbacteria bacterium]